MPADVDTVVSFPRARISRRRPERPSLKALVRAAHAGDAIDRCLVDVVLTLRLLARGRRTVAEAETEVATTFAALRTISRQDAPKPLP